MSNAINPEIARILGGYYGTGGIPSDVTQFLTRADSPLTPEIAHTLVAAFTALSAGNPDPLKATLTAVMTESPPPGVSDQEWARAQVIAHKTHDIPAPPTLDLWETGIYHAEDDRALTQILADIEAVRPFLKEGERPVVVLDLDDTLLTTRIRETRVYHEYAANHRIPRLGALKPGHIVGWDRRVILGDYMGFPAAWIEAHITAFNNHFSDRFFSDDLLRIDPAFAGAVPFVTAIRDAGAIVVYMTGRDNIDMEAGTLAALEANKFPMPDSADVFLFMKGISNKELSRQAGDDADLYRSLVGGSDEVFKADAIAKARRMGIVVATFENEPKNALMFDQKIHEAQVTMGRPRGTAFFIETKCSKVLPLPDHIQRIRGYLRSA